MLHWIDWYKNSRLWNGCANVRKTNFVDTLPCVNSAWHEIRNILDQWWWGFAFLRNISFLNNYHLTIAVTSHQRQCLPNHGHLCICLTAYSRLQQRNIIDREPPVTGGFPHKGTVMRKVFHAMTRSCLICQVENSTESFQRWYFYIKSIWQQLTIRWVNNTCLLIPESTQLSNFQHKNSKTGLPCIWQRLVVTVLAWSYLINVPYMQ